MSLAETIRFSLRTYRWSKLTHWPPQRVERLQQRRLRQLLRWAVARSPFYRRKYRGIDLDRAELSDLPTLRKEELMEHFEEALTDPRIRRDDVERFMADERNLGRWFLGRYSVSHTSGSQGPPLLIVQDRRALGILFAVMASRTNLGPRPGLIEGLRRLATPKRVAIVTLRRGFYPSGSAFEFMPQYTGRFVRMARLSSTQSDLIEQLNAFQPHTLVSYASVLDTLAMAADRLHLDNLRQLGNASEQLTAAARQRLEETFGVPVFDHYGTGECLLLSDGCPTDGGAHVNADWSILEVVDEHNRPVPPGELGCKVLVTNLANRVQPCIRYEIGDRVAMATGPCCCGSRLPRIARLEGRAAELFWTRDGDRYGFVSGPLLQVVADSLGDVREWQAVQQERNRIEVRLQLLPGTRRSGEAVIHAFLQELGRHEVPKGLAIDVQVVTALPPDPVSGKFQRMISRVGPPHDLAI
jgi:phenylacetate-CoA ligase